MTSSSSSEQSKRLPISLPDSVGDRFREILADECEESYSDNRAELIRSGEWDREHPSEMKLIFSAMSRVREETIELCAKIADGYAQPCELRPRPTIQELEAILATTVSAPISINPDGSIGVGPTQAQKIAQDIRALTPTPPSDLDRGESRASPLKEER